MVWVMNDARECCIMQSAAGLVTSNMQMQRKICEPQMNGYAGASVCAYGKVGNFHGHACVIFSNAEYRSGKHINGEMRVRDVGQWQVA